MATLEMRPEMSGNLVMKHGVALVGPQLVCLCNSEQRRSVSHNYFLIIIHDAKYQTDDHARHVVGQRCGPVRTTAQNFEPGGCDPF